MKPALNDIIADLAGAQTSKIGRSVYLRISAETASLDDRQIHSRLFMNCVLIMKNTKPMLHDLVEYV
jgi:hypothetical protein